MAMNLDARKAKIVWISVVDGKEKRVTRTYSLYKDPELDAASEAAVKQGLQALASLSNNPNSFYYYDPVYEII